MPGPFLRKRCFEKLTMNRFVSLSEVEGNVCRFTIYAETLTMSSASSYIGNIPQHYEEYLGPILFEPFADDLAARVPAGTKSVLELACGTGRVTNHLDQRLDAGARLVASDLNPDMINVAK